MIVTTITTTAIAKQKIRARFSFNLARISFSLEYCELLDRHFGAGGTHEIGRAVEHAQAQGIRSLLQLDIAVTGHIRLHDLLVWADANDLNCASALLFRWEEVFYVLWSIRPGFEEEAGQQKQRDASPANEARHVLRIWTTRLSHHDPANRAHCTHNDQQPVDLSFIYHDSSSPSLLCSGNSRFHQQNRHMGNHGFICTHAFRRLAFNADLSRFNTKQFSNTGLDCLTVRADFWLTQDQCGVHVGNCVPGAAYLLQRLLDKDGRIRALPLRIRGRKVAANITGSHGPQQGVCNGV